MHAPLDVGDLGGLVVLRRGCRGLLGGVGGGGLGLGLRLGSQDLHGALAGAARLAVGGLLGGQLPGHPSTATDGVGVERVLADVVHGLAIADLGWGGGDRGHGAVLLVGSESKGVQGAHGSWRAGQKRCGEAPSGDPLGHARPAVSVYGVSR